MKTLITIMVLISNVYANENLIQFFESSTANQVCQNSIVTNGQYYKTPLEFIEGDEKEVFFSFYTNHNSKIIIQDLASGIEREINIEGRIEDIVIRNNKVFYLTNKTLYITERFTDKLITKVRTLPKAMSYQRSGIARGLYLNGDLAYIAHGVFGVIVYDLIKGKHLASISPSVPQPNQYHKSMVTDVEGVNGKLYFTYDDVTLMRNSKAFEGLAIWDIRKNKVHRLVPVNQGREAYYQSNLTIDRDELIVTNLSLNFRHKLKKLERDRYMNPLRRIWKYPLGKVVGRALITGGQLFGCFHDLQTGDTGAGYMSFK